ncbi:MAG: hypothetical protein HZB13_06965 [Acidobacteria bacterium]|nr:hypothetical protein [Acidobacteriota bacterium]
MTAVLLAMALTPPCAWLDGVYQAPPEIAASLLLACPDSDKQRQAERAAEAFRLASQARMPYPEVSAAVSDSVGGKRAEASLQRLDGLGLQVRAVRAMIRVNPRRALEMTLEMPVPAPPAGKCGDVTVARVEEYYGLALQMARVGFTTQEREDGRHVEFLMRVIAASAAPQQLAAAAAMVREFGGSEEEKTTLISSLASAFIVAPGSIYASSFMPALEEEVRALKKGGGGEALEAAFAAYTKAQARNKPCDAAENYVFWESGEPREIQKALNGLRPAPAGADAEWEARFTAVVHRVESWRAEKGAPPMAHFHMKASAYKNLLDLTSSQSLLETAIGSFVQFLKDAPAKTASPAEWKMHFGRVLLPWAPAGWLSVEIARREIRRSGDALMNLLVDAGGN